MKSLYLLTIVFSLTYASTVGHRRSHLHMNDLQRRVNDIRPGQEGYDYREDPRYWRNRQSGQSGGLSSEELIHEDRTARRNGRHEPDEFRPRREPPPKRPSTSTRYRDDQDRRPTREEQVKTILRHVAKAKPAIVIGQQWPQPKQGISGYIKGGVSATVDGDTFASRGIVGLATFESMGVKVAGGNCFVDVSANVKQNLNDPPPRPPRPVEPIAGLRDTYYMKTSDGDQRPVYLDHNGHFYSQNPGNKRIHGNPAVYLRNPGSKRSTVLATIETTTNAPDNSSVSLSAVWQEYYNIYTGLRANATNLLMPVFNDLVSKSNTSYAYEMAWSIQSQLTGSPNEYLDGPYLNGLTNFDDFTDNWLLDAGFWLDGNGTIYVPGNNTISNDTLQLTAKMLTVNDWLKTTYYETWNASVAAINVTQAGSTHTLLEDLVYYAAVVTATNDTSIVSENFYTIDLPTAAEEAAWFLNGINQYY